MTYITYEHSTCHPSGHHTSWYINIPWWTKQRMQTAMKPAGKQSGKKEAKRETSVTWLEGQDLRTKNLVCKYLCTHPKTYLRTTYIGNNSVLLIDFRKINVEVTGGGVQMGSLLEENAFQGPVTVQITLVTLVSKMINHTLYFNYISLGNELIFICPCLVDTFFSSE